jgi:hypothetical protein
MNGEDKKGEANGVMVGVSVTGADCVYKFGLPPLCPSSSLSISTLPQSPDTMAITRREHRECGRSNSRCLRSRVITPTTTAVRALVRKSQQAHMKCMKGGTEIKSNNKKSLGPNNQINGKPAAIRTDMYEF